MTRAECIRALKDEYQERRKQNEIDADVRYFEAVAKDPEIARLREENARLAIDTLKRMSTLQTEQDRRAAAEDMRNRGIANGVEIEQRLEKLGLPRDYLSIRYVCGVCRDTGLVGDAPSRFCDCFERALRFKQYEDGSMANTAQECFERFDANRIPEADGQREIAIRTKEICEGYANTFPNTPFKDIVLTGAGGLGKTFLLNCIYARVIVRGKEAIRITAYHMFEAMRKHYFSETAEESDFDTLLKVPLLLIDDLGSEPMMRNITVESLFILLNERSAAGLHTVIATNLAPMQVRERYGERVMSRLFDRTRCAGLLMKGKDLRTL